MLISQQINFISILMLCHCTLIVWSVSLTRSVSSESTSSNVNKTDKFVTLVDSKAKTIKVSQLSEARLLRSFSSKREVSLWKVHLSYGIAKVLDAPLMFAMSLLNSGQIVKDVLEKNPLELLKAMDYFLSRWGKYLKNRNKINS